MGPLNHVMQATPVAALKQSSQMPSNQPDQMLIMVTENLTYSGDSSTPPARAGAVKRLPQCIIIGARKGGTRALLEFLNLHPGIEKATDEVHFFDDDTKYRMGLDWYRTRMPPSTSEQITIEKSPAYFVTDRVPERMWAMNSSLRLLLIVRDPVVRLISDYAQLAENRRMRRESAGKDKNKVPLFEQVVLTPEGRVNTEYRPVGTSIYAVYFRRWLAYFPRRQIHVIDGDRLIREPFQEVQKVENFLGLPARISEDAFYFNKTKGFYCVRPPDDIQDHCLNESKGRKHPKVGPKVISRLRQFYAPFNREFYSLAGHDFGWPEV
ncbi:heparan sulfate glucosamine 3-O-sulfotransferase 5 [Galendromus occidentalis]|uniref:Heparan sulfate glucosamine 3-O-sulfotransferase 5 n=1 Tax=Galendromus occidentalis TaxID=34638 RepID=A0AAJ6QVZ0_9ACAR|nr:heparan sulfate glucosamine 3-O-sulfotransferase 5 [Galendromus occidentalis]